VQQCNKYQIRRKSLAEDSVRIAILTGPALSHPTDLRRRVAKSGTLIECRVTPRFPVKSPCGHPKISEYEWSDFR
jgi:hypothetical protein